MRDGEGETMGHSDAYVLFQTAIPNVLRHGGGWKCVGTGGKEVIGQWRLQIDGRVGVDARR